MIFLSLTATKPTARPRTPNADGLRGQGARSVSVIEYGGQQVGADLASVLQQLQDALEMRCVSRAERVHNGCDAPTTCRLKRIGT